MIHPYVIIIHYSVYCHVKVIYVQISYVTIYHKTFDLLKMLHTFWGGVEIKPVSTALSSEGQRAPRAQEHRAQCTIAIFLLCNCF